jgi:hypothetical protein
MNMTRSQALRLVKVVVSNYECGDDNDLLAFRLQLAWLRLQREAISMALDAMEKKTEAGE